MSGDLAPAGGEVMPSTMLWTVPVLVTGRRELRRDEPSVRLAAAQSTSGTADFRLIWTRRLRSGQPIPTDVHLGCLWQLSDGANGAMQSLGGARQVPGPGGPLLELQTRSELDGETITLSLDRVAALKRIVLYVYAKNGTPDWSLGPAVSVSLPGQASIGVSLTGAPAAATICALASVHRVGDTLVVRREAEYLRGQQSAVTQAYGFDIAWADVPGRG